MFPIRCYTCNALLAHLHIQMEAMTREGATCAQCLDSFGVDRLCCRRMFLGYVDLTEDLIRFPNKDVVLDDSGTVLKRHVNTVRVVSCD